MTPDEKFHNRRDANIAIYGYIKDLNKEIEITGHRPIINKLEVYANDNQVVYCITMSSKEKLSEWLETFNGDLTRDRLEEHLLYTDVIKNYHQKESRKRLRTPE